MVWCARNPFEQYARVNFCINSNFSLLLFSHASIDINRYSAENWCNKMNFVLFFCFSFFSCRLTAGTMHARYDHRVPERHCVGALSKMFSINSHYLGNDEIVNFIWIYIYIDLMLRCCALWSKESTAHSVWLPNEKEKNAPSIGEKKNIRKNYNLSGT